MKDETRGIEIPKQLPPPIEASTTSVQKTDTENMREQVIQYVYLGDQPIIGGVKIAEKKRRFSKFTILKIQIPEINLPKFQISEKTKILIPIFAGVVLLALSGGAFLALKLGEKPPAPPQNPPEEVKVDQPKTKTKITGNFTFPTTIEDDPLIKNFTEIQLQPATTAINSLQNSNYDLIDQELKSIKFE